MDRIDSNHSDATVSAPATQWNKSSLMATVSIAALIAVCGAFYIGTVFSGSPRETKPVVAMETMGTATAKEAAQDNKQPASKQDIATAQPATVEAPRAADCQEQTWPYIARPCLSSENAKRGVRVISTDKVAEPVIGMVESPPDSVTNRRVAPPEPLKTQAATPAPVVASSNSSPAHSTPLKSGMALGAITLSAETQAAPEKKSGREALEKSKRKAKQRQESERIKTAQSDDESVVETKKSRIKGRIVERWTERDYTVPSYGGGTRRVVVTGRDSSSTERRAYTSERSQGFPNIFGAIFGN